uniref:Uncharacterized protein n=1 Tax=Trichuris muris TaxID=70415 RepID=A0A5S6R4N7_TRIMR
MTVLLFFTVASLLILKGCKSIPIPIIITPGIERLFLKYPYWPHPRDIPGFDPYYTPYSNWNILEGYQPNDPKYYEFMQPIGLPKWAGLILNGIRLGNNGYTNLLMTN